MKRTFTLILCFCFCFSVLLCSCRNKETVYQEIIGKDFGISKLVYHTSASSQRPHAYAGRFKRTIFHFRENEFIYEDELGEQVYHEPKIIVRAMTPDDDKRFDDAFGVFLSYDLITLSSSDYKERYYISIEVNEDLKFEYYYLERILYYLEGLTKHPDLFELKEIEE